MPVAAEFDALQKEVESLNTRLSAIEHSHGAMREAFVLNDLGKPDYDGTRKRSLALIEDAKIIEGYKGDATKKVFGFVAVGVVTLTLTGALEWLKAHIR